MNDADLGRRYVLRAGVRVTQYRDHSSENSHKGNLPSAAQRASKRRTSRKEADTHDEAAMEANEHDAWRYSLAPRGVGFCLVLNNSRLCGSTSRSKVSTPNHDRRDRLSGRETREA